MLAPDLALVEVRFGRVDRNERQLAVRELELQPRITGAEGVFEAEVADVAGVVVAGNPHDPLAGDTRQLLTGERVLVGIAVVGEVARHDDQVGLGRVDLVDGGTQKLLPVAAPADVDVGDLRDQHRQSLGARPRRPRRSPRDPCRPARPSCPPRPPARRTSSGRQSRRRRSERG